MLEKGWLTYGKTAADVSRGRVHDRIDTGLAVISAKTELLRFDIDDEQYIHHLKARNAEEFAPWLELLKQHRLYQQNLTNAAVAGGEGGGGGEAAPRGVMISPRGGSLQRGVRPPGAGSVW